jgi:hypothetical protein
MRMQVASFTGLATVVAIGAAVAGLAAENIASSGDGGVPKGGSLSTGHTALSYPAGWHPVAAPRIPGLDLKNEMAVAPRAGGARLVVGAPPGSDGSPLPRRLLEHLKAPARVEVVTFGGFDAYRYSGLHVGGFDPSLTVYAVPSTRNPTVAVCYASAAGTRHLRTCESIVATLQLESSQSTALAPDPGYARTVTAAIARLNAQRTAERATLVQQDSAGEAAVATRLAVAYDQAAGRVARAPGRNPATAADQRMAAALRTGAAAYRALSSAAYAGDATAYERARNAIERADANLGTTLLELSSAAVEVGRSTR